MTKADIVLVPLPYTDLIVPYYSRTGSDFADTV